MCATLYEFADAATPPSGPPPTSAAGKAEMDFGGPLLDAEWRDDGMHLFGVGCNKTVKMWSLQSNAVQDIGSHDGPIKSCHWVKEKQFLVTTGWDMTIRYWDARSPNPQVRARVGRRVDGVGCGTVAADGATRTWRDGVTRRPSWCARMTHAAQPLGFQLMCTVTHPLWPPRPCSALDGDDAVCVEPAGAGARGGR